MKKEKRIANAINKLGAQSWAARGLAMNSTDILDIEEGRYCQVFVDAICKIAEKNDLAAHELAFRSAEMLQSVGAERYKMIVDALYELCKEVNKLPEGDDRRAAAVYFAKNSARIIKGERYYYVFETPDEGELKKIEIDQEYIPLIFDAFNEIVDYDPWSAYVLASNSTEIINDISDVYKKYLPAVFEAAKKLAKKDGWGGYELARESKYVLNGIDKSKEINANALITEFLTGDYKRDNVKGVHLF